MLSKILNTAVLAMVLTCGLAQAQSFAQLGGPVNLPPAGFSGEQFVDNRGCLFLRAGFGDVVNWVPRVNRDHAPLCGYPPTFGAAVIAAVNEDMAPEPVAAARPVQVAVPAQVEPVPQPQAAAPRQGTFWAMLFAPSQPRVDRQPAAVLTVAAPVVVDNSVPKPPKGYKLAWDDDRLNPLRGVGTAQGQAQQDQVWTREVPAQLVVAKPQKAATARVTVSTMSAPAPQMGRQAGTQAVAGHASYVQVGTFGQPENAAAVRARLMALGLPVSTARIDRKGKILQVVYAGPFGSAVAAQAALVQARGAGFGDAILK